MSVFVHVGQCGNQLGDAFWRLTADARRHESDTSKLDPTAVRKKSSGPSIVQQQKSAMALPLLYSDQFFHRRTRRARCIIVDTEPKVIRSILRSWSSESARFEPAHVHFEQSGRGNNWAMGYNFQTHQRNVIASKSIPPPPPLHMTSLASNSTTRKKLSLSAATDGGGDKRELVELVMDSLRQEIEALDVYRGSILMHSLGGGTGAGLGCRLLETIRDTYPRGYLAAVSIAPSCSSGDTPLQNYNALFTLQHLQQHTDCVLYYENDELMKTALYWKALVASTSGASSPRDAALHDKVTLREMNALAACGVAGLVFPTVRSHPSGRGGGVLSQAHPFDLAKVVHDCCPLPSAKFLDVRSGVLRQNKLQGSTKMMAAGDPLFHGVPQCQTGVEDERAMVTKLSRCTVQSYPRWTSASRAIGGSAVLRYGSNTGNGAEGGDPTKAVQDSLTGSLPRFHLGNSVDISASSYAPFQAYGGRGSLTVALNHGHAMASINHFLDRGRKQFHANAYTHWYKQHGLENDDFENAFEQTTQIVAQYQELLGPL